MVEIKNISGQRVEVSKGNLESKSPDKVAKANANVSGEKVDAVLTSKSREALKVMAENPSINMEAVERIKQKIKDLYRFRHVYDYNQILSISLF